MKPNSHPSAGRTTQLFAVEYYDIPGGFTTDGHGHIGQWKSYGPSLPAAEAMELRQELEKRHGADGVCSKRYAYQVVPVFKPTRNELLHAVTFTAKQYGLPIGGRDLARQPKAALMLAGSALASQNAHRQPAIATDRRGRVVIRLGGAK